MQSTISRGSDTSTDPATFEVVKNALMNVADLMAEQVLRTCHSIVIYSRDFSSALCDAEGNTVAQGKADFAGAIGNIHLTAKSVLASFEGDVRPGDIYVVNDPYLGSTHFNDVRVVRPIFWDGDLIAVAITGGHWADIGGTVPGSLDATLPEHFGEGLRIPPVRLWEQDIYRPDLATLITLNTRAPDDAEGDLQACAEATRVAEREVSRLIEKYGREMIVGAFGYVQDYVERLTRDRISTLPDGTWESVDYLDQDPASEEGLVPIRVSLTVSGDQLVYDLSGSHPSIANNYNTCFGASFSAVVGTTKLFFPELPLNSGFYRAVSFDPGPPGTVVNASAPTAVGGMGMPYEKLLSATMHIWSHLVPERAMATSYNLEYLALGGTSSRYAESEFFMHMDWLAGGWGGRNGLDGTNTNCPVFCPTLTTQPVEVQERLYPILITEASILPDSGGPGRYRGGCGVRKSLELREMSDAKLSYICDRERSVVAGSEGGLPSVPQGLWWAPPGGKWRFLGATVSNLSVETGGRLTRPSAGGGGFGDPLERDPEAVLQDVVEGYVTGDRARADYGVVVHAVDADPAGYEVDSEATERERTELRGLRLERLDEDPVEVARRFRNGELSYLDLVRSYGVIVDWGTGELHEKTTEAFRALFKSRVLAIWEENR